jgi:hypothetical protein
MTVSTTSRKVRLYEYGASFKFILSMSEVIRNENGNITTVKSEGRNRAACRLAPDAKADNVLLDFHVHQGITGMAWQTLSAQLVHV